MRRMGMLGAIVLALIAGWLAYDRWGGSRPVETATTPEPSSVATPLGRRTAEHPDTALEGRLRKIVERASGRYAIVAKHLGTGAVARVNGDTAIALMSVVKLPVAVVVLDGVDQGRWSLNTPVTLIAQDMHPRGWLGDRYPSGGGPVLLRRLIVEALTRSDNTAADVLMRLIGGPRAVTDWLLAHGIHDLRVDRTQRGLGNDWYGLPAGSDTLWSAEEIRELRAQVPDAAHDSAARALLLDPRDTGTADACVHLLERLWHGDLLSAEMTDTLKSILGRCKTAPNRLPGMLPKGTPVARKTGTGGMSGGITVAINDVGVIRLPNGEDVAIAVLVGEPRGTVRAERLIARVAREVYDAWSRPDSSGAIAGR